MWEGLEAETGAVSAMAFHQSVIFDLSVPRRYKRTMFNAVSSESMKRLLGSVALSALMPAAMAITASATPVTYTDSVIASGSLGGVAFTNQLITLTGSANTTNITNTSSGVYLLLTSASVMIGSGSAVNFTDTIQAADNQTFTDAGFGDNSNGNGILFTVAPAFGTYNLQTAISQSGSNGINNGTSFGTAGGAFIINSVTGSSTFSAVLGTTAATPEPSSLCLLGTGILGCAGGIARRFRKS